LKNLTALFFGLCISFIILELGLRIYNPLPVSIKGNDIVIRSHYKILYQNDIHPKLPSEISVTGNSLGFRGPEPKEDDQLKILTVGGSTTRCTYSSDSSSWSFLLGENIKSVHQKSWLNNAGFSGHSTYGHLILMQDYVVKLKPDLVIFLFGLNDIERDITDDFTLQPKSALNTFSGKMKSFLYRSEVIALGLNLYRFLEAKKINLNYGFDFDLKNIPTIELSEDEVNNKLKKQSKFLKQYEQRVEQLINFCFEHNIKPILCTQPALFGNSIDPSTKLDLAKMEYNEANGKTMWQVLELYNGVTKKVALEKNVALIDLANQLPKDSKYYWDFVHYTPEGNKEIARILSAQIIPLLSEKAN